MPKIVVFDCLKCSRRFFNIKEGEEHQKNCTGKHKGFRIPPTSKHSPRK